MRLKSIKLAGFKSFVDPTTVPFPTNLTAVVGPNGCGKSNIIDAVRWVMGESSAKNLRGESMTDVIFNGATTRKPVGQASIELIFDNTEGKLLGEYANFSEISIRRRVTRDATSDYFLNGTKCRRRDITDIFLGTGLGPRSYAIIEQGMISKLIESKPEELRVFLEEAAGISKYKERRKETESRLRRTQDNLNRLTDIRDELERQLQHLHKQAQSAEKYTELKAEERLKKAQIAALRWVEMNALVVDKQGNISAAELELEKAITERVSHESRIEELRLTHTEKNDEFNQVQASYYASGAEIAKLEQSIRHQKDRLLQLAKDKQEAQLQILELQRELDGECQRKNEVSESLAEMEPLLEEQLALSEEAAIELLSQEEAMHDWQHGWDEFNLKSADARKKAEIEQSRIQQLEANIRKADERRSRLVGELQLLENQMGDEDLELGREQLAELEMKEGDFFSRKDQVQASLSSNRQSVDVLDSRVAELRAESQTLQGTIASLSALQSSALGGDRSDFEAHLKRHGLEDASRVAELLQVTDGWEQAAECALKKFLTGFSVDSIGDRASDIAGSGSLGLTLVESSAGDAGYQRVSPPVTLADVIAVDSGLTPMASYIRLADCLDDALKVASSLQDFQSIVTKTGVLLGNNWICFPDNEDPATGTLYRQRELEKYTIRLSEVMASLELASAEVDMAKSAIEALELQRESLITSLSSLQKDKSVIAAGLSAIEARQEQIRVRIRDLKEGEQESQLHLEEESERLTESRYVWQEALDEVGVYADQKERILEERDLIRERLDDLRQKARHDKDTAHQLQLKLQSLQAERSSLEKNSDRAGAQLDRLTAKQDELSLAHAELDFPLEDMQISLEELLETRVQEEESLSLARQVLEKVDSDLRSDESNRQNIEQRVQVLRNVLQDIRMEAQALEIKRNSLKDQLREDNYDLASVIEALPAEATLPAWEEEIAKIAGRVQRLGAINLAAIEEYKIQKERKEYLDEQNADLVEAITTLENAIRKIDKETRAKFKETYDKVNSGLQALFPKVFGGGSAYLELTGDDMLETGVAIMARPPGKKNSTIHLLSGGEKALTAIALVFSIFQLNPAPFCMLDEVDAPLDDANVGRYANLVKEMSSQVQFIYISHNKIAMEMADQLMGVTMHEPGVSRLVSVNVEEAVAMASL